MDYLIIIAVIIGIVVALKVIKSAVKFAVVTGLVLFALYYMDMQGIIDLGPILDQLGIS